MAWRAAGLPGQGGTECHPLEKNWNHPRQLSPPPRCAYGFAPGTDNLYFDRDVGMVVPEGSVFLIMAFPHMHVKSTHMRVDWTRTDGSVRTIHDGAFDFNYQRTYILNDVQFAHRYGAVVRTFVDEAGLPVSVRYSTGTTPDVQRRLSAGLVHRAFGRMGTITRSLMKRYSKLAACSFLLALGCGSAPEPAPQAFDTLAQTDEADAPASILNGPVKGKLGEKPFTGTFSATRFVEEKGTIYVVGQLTGVSGVSSEDERFLETPGTKLELSVAPEGGFPSDVPIGELTCEVLALYTQPQTVPAGGKTVSFEKVELDITSTPGAGNVLGQILCGVSDLFKNGGRLAGLNGDTTVLVQILDGLVPQSESQELAESTESGEPAL